ncbi:MAG: DUF547 domain-containing protein [Trichodesmium sp. MAG_R04]|nr:DUF547 domain-containing protein [Trichodesmium sp. MAG_R04]
MKFKFKKLLFLFPILLILASCSRLNNLPNIEEQTQEIQELTTILVQPFNYQKYNSILKDYVNSRGLVDYKKLKENRQQLDEFNYTIGAVSLSNYNSWKDSEKIAFLINAYNSFTLESIIDNYPTKSIRNIIGVWKIRKFNVASKKITLDHIEHQILRKEFNQPGIHVALVCAAISCPPLRQEAYTGRQLEEQLNDQAKKFLGNSQSFRIDSQNKTIYLSSIFKWFGKDFEENYGQTENIEGLNKTETAIVNYARKYVNSNAQKFLEKGGYKVKYSDYDWSLNIQ